MAASHNPMGRPLDTHVSQCSRDRLGVRKRPRAFVVVSLDMRLSMGRALQLAREGVLDQAAGEVLIYVSDQWFILVWPAQGAAKH